MRHGMPTSSGGTCKPLTSAALGSHCHASSRLRAGALLDKRVDRVVLEGELVSGQCAQDLAARRRQLQAAAFVRDELPEVRVHPDQGLVFKEHELIRSAKQMQTSCMYERESEA
jgi:hypothetical protein